MTRGHRTDDRHLLLVATVPAPDPLVTVFGPVPLAAVPVGGQPLLHWTWQRALQDRRPAKISVVIPAAFAALARRVPGASPVTVADDAPLGASLAVALASCTGPVTVITTNLQDAEPDTNRTAFPPTAVTTVDDPQAVADDAQALAELAFAVELAARAPTQENADVIALSRMQTPVRTRTGTHITFEDGGATIRKHHHDEQKLVDEVLWYQSLPTCLADIAPRVVRTGGGWYDTERVEAPTLGDIWVFGAATSTLWNTVTEHIESVLDRLHGQPAAESSDTWDHQREMYVAKTINRIEQLRNGPHTLPDVIWKGAVVNGTATAGLEEVTATIEDTYRKSGLAGRRRHCVIHGDFHLGNVFYLSDQDSLRLIDPRGSFGSQRGIHGDPVYDELKLAHSIVGNYDAVVVDAFDLQIDGRHVDLTYHLSPAGRHGREGVEHWLRRRFETQYGLTGADVKLGVAVLLLSLAALHHNPRQRIAHLLRGLQLFEESR